MIFLLTAILIIGAVPAAFASSTEERLVTVNAERGVSVTVVLRDRDDRREDDPEVRVTRVVDSGLFRTHNALVEILDISVRGAGTRDATVSISRDRRLYVYDAQRRFVGTTENVHYFSSRFFLSSSPINFGTAAADTVQTRPAATTGRTTTAPAPPPAVARAITPAGAQTLVSQALQAAGPEATPSIRLTNPGVVDLASLQAVASAAQGRDIVINADTLLLRPAGDVDVRIRLNPALATTGVNLSGSTISTGAIATQNFFQQHFTNTVSVVSLGQQGDFGMEVRIAARVDVPAGFNLQNLRFHSYDRAENRYRSFTPSALSVCSSGFLHFTTSMAGDIVITTSALERR